MTKEVIILLLRLWWRIVSIDRIYRLNVIWSYLHSTYILAHTSTVISSGFQRM